MYKCIFLQRGKKSNSSLSKMSHFNHSLPQPLSDFGHIKSHSEMVQDEKAQPLLLWSINDYDFKFTDHENYENRHRSKVNT